MGKDSLVWEGPIPFALDADEVDKEITRISLVDVKAVGFFSVQVEILTGGQITLEYEISNATPVQGKKIPANSWDGVDVTALVTGQGVGWSEVLQNVAGEKLFGKNLRIIATETASVAVTGNLYPNLQ